MLFFALAEGSLGGPVLLFALQGAVLILDHHQSETLKGRMMELDWKLTGFPLFFLVPPVERRGPEAPTPDSEERCWCLEGCSYELSSESEISSTLRFELSSSATVERRVARPAALLAAVNCSRSLIEGGEGEESSLAGGVGLSTAGAGNRVGSRVSALGLAPRWSIA